MAAVEMKELMKEVNVSVCRHLNPMIPLHGRSKVIRRGAFLVFALYTSLRIYKRISLRCRLAQKVKERQKQRQDNMERIKTSLLTAFGKEDQANMKLTDKELEKLLLTSEVKELTYLDVSELTKELRTGSLTCVQVLQAFQAKAYVVNLTTNAVTEFIDESLDWARQLDQLPADKRGALHGIPISCKEHINFQGKDTTVGCPSMIGEVKSADAGLVALLKSLGAIPFCRTNLPQTCISFDCSNPIFGVTANPRDLTRSPGGSSGGEGALVAAGGSVMGLGSDLGGSVRMPSAFCGVTGLKPTAGRVPLTGQTLDGGALFMPGPRNSLGFLAKSVECIESVLGALLSTDMDVQRFLRDPRFIPIRWDRTKRRDGQKLRIGWFDDDGIFLPTPGCRRVVHHAVNLLKNLGHELVPFTPPRAADIRAQWGLFLLSEEGKLFNKLLDGGAVDHSAIGPMHFLWSASRFMRTLAWPLVRYKSPLNAGALFASKHCRYSSQIWEMNAELNSISADVLESWEQAGVDVVLCPTMVMPASPIGYPAWQMETISYTSTYNYLNFPAGTLPVGKWTQADESALDLYPGYEKDYVYGLTKDGARGSVGLPLSVQIIGRPWQEELVLRVMQELQEEI